MVVDYVNLVMINLLILGGFFCIWLLILYCMQKHNNYTIETYLFSVTIFFFFRVLSYPSASDNISYHQIKTSIGFWGRWGLNSKSLIRS